jgi:hypothetical protein
MLKIFLFFIAGSVLVSSMSIDNFFIAVFHSINYINVDINLILHNLMELLDLGTGTGIPANGYHFTNLNDLIDMISQANYIYELGFTRVNGVLVYAIKIGLNIYYVEPDVYHSLIYTISHFLLN